MKKVLNTILTLVLLGVSLQAVAQINRANSKKTVLYKANYQRAAAAGDHTFEIKDGTLWVCGRNQWGQLGDGTTMDRSTMVQVGTDNKWISVTGGYEHSIGLKSDGTIWGWGLNTSGQVGDGTAIQRNSPVQIGNDNKWISVEAGYNHTLALKSDGTLWAWGAGWGGALGDGTMLDRTSPVQIGTDNKWVSISAGYHSIGLKSDGTLWAWGANVAGAVGDGTIINRASPVQIGVDNKWVNISAGNNFSGALKSDGTLWLWGGNSFAQVGDGTTIDRLSPVQIGTDNKWTFLSLGSFHSSALKSDGTAWAWGNNSFGQLGNGTLISANSPSQIGSDNKWVLISASCGGHTVASKADGSLWSFGYNYYGQLNNGTLLNNSSPILISTDDKWLDISGGYSHSVGLRTNGTLWAWGANSYGQVGDGTTVQKNNPTQIGTDNQWVGVETGAYFSLGLKANGTLWSWGNNPEGQLGDGTVVLKTSPIQVGTDNKWVSMSAGFDHSLGLKSDGTLWAWGRNTSGQLGDGTNIQKTTPVQIGTDNKWVSISAGSNFSLGLKSDGTLWAWGNSSNGQLGDGTTINKNTPIQIGTDTKWYSISAGQNSVLAKKTDGTLWSWGNNSVGQLGDGTQVAKLNPTQVGTDNKWLLIAAGETHGVTLKSNGNLWSFGQNFGGEVGNGNNNLVLSPIQIGTDNNWVNITGGGSFSAAIKADRELFCVTGSNVNGQLGTGNTISLNTYNCICALPVSPTNTTSSLNLVICSGDNTTLTASGIASLGWYSSPSGGSYLGGGSSFSTPVLTSNTSFYVQDSTCGSSVRTQIMVTVNPLPTVVINASNTSLCAGQSLVLTGGGASTYNWAGGVIDGASFVPTSTNTYSLTGTDVNGCVNTATQTVVVNALPMVTANATNTTVCFNDGTPITLTGTGADTYSWDNGVNDGVSFLPSISNTYTVSGTDVNGCVNNSSIAVTVNTVDVGVSVITFGTFTSDQAGAGYQWIDCNTQSAIIGETNQNFTPTVNGDYAVIVTSNGCTDTSACQSITNVGVDELNLIDILVFPNPSNGEFTIQSATEGRFYIQNELGQILQEIVLNATNNFNVKIEDLASGVYFITGLHNEIITCKKIVITK